MLFNNNNTFPDLISSVLIFALLLISIIDIAPTKPIATPIILVFTTFSFIDIIEMTFLKIVYTLECPTAFCKSFYILYRTE